MILDDCFKDTEKRCVNSPTKYCQHRGNLVQCVRTKGCVVPEEYRNHNLKGILDD